MRRNDREITDSREILSIVNECKVIRLAMLDEQGLPYIIPLNFGYRFADGVFPPTTPAATATTMPPSSAAARQSSLRGRKSSMRSPRSCATWQAVRIPLRKIRHAVWRFSPSGSGR